MPGERHKRFLSTPSGWRATSMGVARIAFCSDFYPRPPGGGRPEPWCSERSIPFISIHALRVEGDTFVAPYRSGSSDFYPRPPGGGRHHRLADLEDIERFLSTPSGWRATISVLHIVLHFDISIHALRVEGDPAGSDQRLLFHYFYPRPPGGGRQQKRTKFSSVFAQKGEEFASLRRGKRKFAGGVLKRTNFGL